MGQLRSASASTGRGPRLQSIGVWLVWTAVIALLVWPWRDTMDHTHWEKVGWIPFISPPVKPSDMIANVLLYMPFGYFGLQAMGRARGDALAVAVAAALLSLTTESIQLYSHWRFPTATDVVCNVLGCVAGSYLSQGLSRSLSRTSQELSS
jgi:glycopeptide antibiotics resistance protein